MPSKSYRRKRTTKRRTYRRKRRFFKKKFIANRSMIKYIAGPGQFVPPRLRTKFNCSAKVILASGMTTTDGAIYANVLTTPLNNSYQAMWVNAIPSHLLVSPVGARSLLNANLYRDYRVYGCKMSVTALAEDPTDSCEFIIIPVTETAASGVSLLSIQELRSEPFAKYGMLTNARPYRASGYMTTSRIYGVAKKAIEYDVSGSFIGNYVAPTVPTNKWYWWVFTQTSDLGPTVGDVSIVVNMTFYAELFNPTYGYNTLT